jgi:hypothetical protein
VTKQGRGKAFIDQKFGEEKKSGAVDKDSRYKLLRQFYSYFFWFGYYGYTGRRFLIFRHILKDIFGYLNALRFFILKKISR